MMNILIEKLTIIGIEFIYAAVVILFIYAAKKIADFESKNIDDDKEIEEYSNFAIGIKRAGLYIGLALGMMGPLVSEESHYFLTDLQEMAIDGVFVITILFASRFLTEKIFFGGSSMNDMLKNRNHAAGIVEFGIYISEGLILNGSFSGVGGGIAASLLFFMLGQISLIVLVKIYQKSQPVKLFDEIKEGNDAAAIAVAGIMIALSIILRASIAGNFHGWVEDLTAFGISAFSGIAALIVMKKIVDFLFLPHTTLETEIKRDRNCAALILTESILIAFALILSTLI